LVATATMTHNFLLPPAKGISQKSSAAVQDKASSHLDTLELPQF